MTREAAQAALERAIGGERREWAVARVTIREDAPSEWSADLWLYGAAGGGERTIHGTSCQQIAQAAILIVALAFEAGSDAAALESTAPATEVSTPVHFGVGARAGLDVGSLPKPDLGFALTLALEYGRLRVEFEGSAWLPRTSALGPTPDSGGNFSLFTGGVRACWNALRVTTPYALGPCAGVELGGTYGRGIGVSHREDRLIFWGAGLVGAVVRYQRIPSFWIGLSAELGVPVHRPEWQFKGYSTVVFQPSPVLGRLSLSTGWMFP